jgi:hypothetical protein
MLRFHLWLAVSAFLVAGCASPHDSSGRRWDFAIEGRLDSVTAADIAAVVAAMGDKKIYRLRIINRDRVEVDTSPERYQVIRRAGDAPETHSVQYTVVKRVHGVWKTGEMAITVF